MMFLVKRVVEVSSWIALLVRRIAVGRYLIPLKRYLCLLSVKSLSTTSMIGYDRERRWAQIWSLSSLGRSRIRNGACDDILVGW